MEARLPVPENPDLTDWVSWLDWDEHKHWFKSGDLVEFNRRECWFNHWGLYLGNGLLVHVTRYEVLSASSQLLSLSTMASQASPSLAGSSAGMATGVANLLVTCGERVLGPSPPDVGRRAGDQGRYFVRTDDILTVADHDKFRVNNVANNAVQHVQRSFPEIFDLVSSYQNGVFDYSVLRRNCEHFVTFLRYRYGQPGTTAGN